MLLRCIIFLLYCLSINNILLAYEINVPVGRDEMYTATQDIASIDIGDKTLVEIGKQGTNKLSVYGKNIGKTAVVLYNNNDEAIETLNINVIDDIPAVRYALKQMFGKEKIGIEYVDGNIVLTGSVSTAETAQNVLNLVKKLTNRTKPKEIINLTSIGSGQQIMLRVRIGEIKKTAMFMLGNSWLAEYTKPTSKLKGSTFASDTVIDKGLFGYNNAGSILYNATDFTLKLMLSAMQQEGLFKVLAEPNLVAISGETAKFHAGSEIAVPIAQAQGANTIEYKPVGVSLAFTPIALSDERIRILVEPEVSEIADYDQLQSTQTYKLPNITTRKASTTVELAPGESFMIAGLIKNQARTRSASLPYLSRVPIVGTFFKAADYEEEASELVISITPYIVNPVNNDDIRLPVDDHPFPTALQALVMGRTRGSYQLPESTPSLEGSYGYIMD